VLSSLLSFLLCRGTRESKSSTFRNSQFCLAEKKSQDFHIWILAIVSAREENARRFPHWILAILFAREENARRLPHLETCNFNPWSFSLA
jgi:hypothetical protein